MKNLDQLTQYVNIHVPIKTLILDLILTAICALVLRFFYIKFGQSLSNRKRLASNFVAIAVTTALVITIVKSSLALSLGLVGALSIVRFRTAIKDPEELSYLFLCIALGLGFGAQQREVTLAAFFIILSILWLQVIFIQTKHSSNNLLLNLNWGNKTKINTEDLVKITKRHTTKIDLKRVSHQKQDSSLSGYIELAKATDLSKLTTALKKKYPNLEITATDTSGLLG